MPPRSPLNVSRSAPPSQKLRLAVAGNPNSGKTTIFNALTGAHQAVGNWPGVTVERKEGRFRQGEFSCRIIDLPGTYSLSSFSIEEKIARSYIMDEDPDLVINVVDASNLDRNLFLTTQLIEVGVPLVIVLNKMDMARDQGYTVDAENLGILLGAPVVEVVGRTGEGIDALRRKIERVVRGESLKQRKINVVYPREVEEETQNILPLLEPGDVPESRQRWTALKLLEGDCDLPERLDPSESHILTEQVTIARERIKKIYQDTAQAVITQARYGFIQGALRECVLHDGRPAEDYSRSIDRVLTHRWLGLPIFALFMWLMFKATYELGAYPMDWIDQGVAWLMNMLSGLLPESMVASLIVDGAIGGVGAIAVFLPNIFILFFIIAFLEDSGYMARVAFIMDRVMHNIGLHGKAFIPMIMGFGCNVPAIMGTRILESRRDRLLTVLINPFMSCSARLPVYVLVAGAFFPNHAATVIFAMYVTGILVAIGSGKLFSKTILAGMSKPFVLELPPYQKPTLRSLMLHTWERGSLFIRKMGTVILVGSILVWALGYFPREVELERDYEEERATVFIENLQRSVVIQDRFEESVERVRQNYLSTLVPFEESGVYQSLTRQRDSLNHQLILEEQARLDQIRKEEVAEITSQKLIGRVGRLFEPLVAPLGFTWREGVALVTGFVAKEIVVSTYGVLFGVGEGADETSDGVIQSLRSSGMTPLVAFGFLVFTLLYTPCLATVAAIRRETGTWGYTLFSVGYSLALAWILAFAIYRIGGLFL